MALSAARKKSRAVASRWRKIAALIALLVLVAIGAAIVNNNVSIPRPSRAEFVDQLDRTLDHSTGWAYSQFLKTATGRPTPDGLSLISNSATAHMIVDCASLSNAASGASSSAASAASGSTHSDPRMKALGASFVDAWELQASVFSKMVDPSIPANPPNLQELQGLEEYQRWTLHGIDPNDVSLTPQELQDMLSPDKYRTGKATHQLLALYFYRRFQGSTPELDRLMQTIERRIAREATVDFRVTDLYLQRVAFLLAAGRPDLVRPRWVERAFAAQQPDGGWLQNWHGWSRTPYRFTFAERQPTPHATAQGMWIACMLKYRYPEWVEQNYKIENDK